MVCRYALLPFPVEVRKCRISTPHSKSDARDHAACWRTACAASARRGGWWFIELQHLHPLLFHPHHFTHTHTHTHTHTLSLSLSLSLTHTHTLPAASCCDFAVDTTVNPCVLCLRQNCYSHLNKINPIFFSHPEKLIAPLPPSPNPSHGVSRSQVQKAGLALP